jgi:hypothetical protein
VPLAMHRDWRLRRLSATAQTPRAAAPRRSGRSRTPRVLLPPLSVMQRRPVSVQQTAWRLAPMRPPSVTAALPSARGPMPLVPIPWPWAGQRIRLLTVLPRSAPTPLAGRRRLRPIRSPSGGSPASLRQQPPALPSAAVQPRALRAAWRWATAPRPLLRPMSPMQRSEVSLTVVSPVLHLSALSASARRVTSVKSPMWPRAASRPRRPMRSTAASCFPR